MLLYNIGIIIAILVTLIYTMLSFDFPIDTGINTESYPLFPLFAWLAKVTFISIAWPVSLVVFSFITLKRIDNSTRGLKGILGSDQKRNY